MTQPQKIFSEYLKKNNLKNTPERMIILQEILKLKTHVEAETLLDHFKSLSVKISRASIYRTLELLVSCNLVKKTLFNNNSYYFEPIIDKKSHDHFICRDCGKIIEFYDEELGNIHLRLKNNYNITIDDYTHQIYGKCANCTNNNKSTN